MRPLDIAIAISSLDANPDPQKADMLREEVRLALERQEISGQTYCETLALLARASRPLPAARVFWPPP
jgi:hypothetical protein